jgi:hypothetical protein
MSRVLLFALVTAACGAPAGSNGGDCYPNDTCDHGFSCVEGACHASVTLPDGGQGLDGALGTGGDGGQDTPANCAASCGSSAGECDGTACGSGAYCVAGACLTTGTCKTGPNNTCSNHTYSLRLNDPDCADTSLGVNDYHHQPCPGANFGELSPEHDWGIDWFSNGAHIPGDRLLIVYPLSDWWVGVQLGHPCAFSCLASYVASGPGEPVAISVPASDFSPSWELIVEGMDTGGTAQAGPYVISFEDAPSMVQASTIMTRLGPIDVADIRGR